MTGPRGSTLLSSAALVLALAGCESRYAHIFGGYAYDVDGGADGGCLKAPGVIDVLDGPEPASPCESVRCWLSPDGTAYVTDRACDGPSDFQEQTKATAGPCAGALAAYGADGGKVQCPAPPDGGS